LLFVALLRCERPECSASCLRRRSRRQAGHRQPGGTARRAFGRSHCVGAPRQPQRPPQLPAEVRALGLITAPSTHMKFAGACQHQAHGCVCSWCCLAGAARRSGTHRSRRAWLVCRQQQMAALRRPLGWPTAGMMTAQLAAPVASPARSSHPRPRGRQRPVRLGPVQSRLTVLTTSNRRSPVAPRGC
jgi:hypothetical protein